jgi:hypothetical protein
MVARGTTAISSTGRKGLGHLDHHDPVVVTVPRESLAAATKMDEPPLGGPFMAKTEVFSMAAIWSGRLGAH